MFVYVCTRTKGSKTQRLIEYEQNNGSLFRGLIVMITKDTIGKPNQNTPG